MKVSRSYTTLVMGLLALMMVLVFSVSGCAPRKTGTQPPQIATGQQPTVIELSDSRLQDMLEGDIPEEDRSDLPWLPQRPPLGMQFEESQELHTIYFEFDKYSLTEDARNTLNRNAEWLKNHPDVSVQIEGHCDERGTLEYNEVLGENRAVSTKKYLVSLGIHPDRLYTISYGESQPTDPGHTEEAWAKNRRAVFKIGR